MSNTIPTQQQKAQMLNSIVRKVEQINIKGDLFIYDDGSFTESLMDMYIDSRELFLQASADYFNETLMTMFERAVFDRNTDGHVELIGEHEDLSNTPQYLKISYDFASQMFDTLKSISLFLSRMGAHYENISATTHPAMRKKVINQTVSEL